MAACILLAFAMTALAQPATVTNPTRVRFQASADHAVMLDARTPAVTDYTLGIFAPGATEAVVRYDLGKLAPDPQGVIEARLDAVLFGWPLSTTTTYTAKVAANGPRGSTWSEASNPFTFNAQYALANRLGTVPFGPRLIADAAREGGQIDFDGDHVADVAVYRRSTGTWFSLDSSANDSTHRQRVWGLQALGDTPAPGDYDGDGIVDPTVYRLTTGTWFILRSSSGFATWSWHGWGGASDALAPGDYDGDGTTDLAVYRPSTGQWFVLPSSAGFSRAWVPITFGDPEQGDVPVAGDFDGDGKRDPAVYRPSTGTWFWLRSSAGFAQYDYRGSGVQAEGDVPVPGDYDGDGKTDPAVYRPRHGTWFVLESSGNYAQHVASGWGAPDDVPAPGDYDGDGRADVGVYRPSTSEWFVKPSGGSAAWTAVFGQPGDVPLAGIH